MLIFPLWDFKLWCFLLFFLHGLLCLTVSVCACVRVRIVSLRVSELSLCALDDPPQHQFHKFKKLLQGYTAENMLNTFHLILFPLDDVECFYSYLHSYFSLLISTNTCIEWNCVYWIK